MVLLLLKLIDTNGVLKISNYSLSNRFGLIVNYNLFVK